MSYSRWSNSYWYTYWCGSSAKTIEDELFNICGVLNFSYKELKEDINFCLRKVKKECHLIYDPDRWPSKDEMKELRGYMKEFIEDVEQSDAGKLYFQEKILDRKLEGL